MKHAVIIGSGKVASHLAPFINRCFPIVQVFSKDLHHAHFLAAKLSENCSSTDNLKELKIADLYILSVIDDAIRNVLKEVPDRCKNALWLHTSGNKGIDVFQDFNVKHGVLYPLQSFSGNNPIALRDIPFLIEVADDLTAREDMAELITTLHLSTTYADSHKRKIIHIAAVFANNFTNYMYTIANRLLTENGIPLSVLFPLIHETVNKLEQSPPEENQTGPAARGDVGTIISQLECLSGEPEKSVYKMLSSAIFAKYNHKELEI